MRTGMCTTEPTCSGRDACSACSSCNVIGGDAERDRCGCADNGLCGLAAPASEQPGAYRVMPAELGRCWAEVTGEGTTVAFRSSGTKPFRTAATAYIVVAYMVMSHTSSGTYSYVTCSYGLYIIERSPFVPSTPYHASWPTVPCACTSVQAYMRMHACSICAQTWCTDLCAHIRVNVWTNCTIVQFVQTCVCVHDC